MATTLDLFDQAVRHHQSGNLQEAAALYRQILEADPAHATAHRLLGLLAQQAGHHEEAVALFRRAIALDPDYAQAHNNLGHALHEEGRLADAVACYRQALRCNPNSATAYYNLGNALKDQGNLDEAVECYHHALRLNPQHADAHNNLGIALNLEGRLAEAIASFQEALRLNPRHADARANLGNALTLQGQIPEAAECIRQALRLNPDDARAHNLLGNCLAHQGLLDEALAAYRESIRLEPNYAEAHANLGNALKDQGRLDEAIACHERARIIKPEEPAYHGNLLHCLIYHPGYDSEAIFAEHRHWEQQQAPAFGPPAVSWDNDASPRRRLRIGYLSPDFRDHVVGSNVWPLLRHHDRDQFDITLYANSLSADAMTEQFRSCAQNWRLIAGWPDEQVVTAIRDDRIDILVDLALHTHGNRLAVFARKPAPVQVTFAGYPGTTGLLAIDYRLTDPHLDPPGLFDAWYAEESYRLPHSFWCYDPQTEEPAVAPLPCLESGFITFGCLNNFCKVNDEVLGLWARVLRAVPGSRLRLLAKEGSHRRRTLDLLARQGIASERVGFLSYQPQPEYLALYHQLDMGLDTFPYNGHTTSLDSLWMGMPVVTLVGRTVVGRAGFSQLTNLGLGELAAFSPDDFVRIAVDLAGDVPRLQALRAGLRRRMEKSPLMDGVGFARGIEEAYRVMWGKWCGQDQVSLVGTHFGARTR